MRWTLTDPANGNRDSGRLLSLDALRGITMLLLIPDISGGFSFYKMTQRFPDDPLWSFLSRTFTHSQWSGCTLWDLIMPLFIFMVGVSMPYSYAARCKRQDTPAMLLTHAVERSFTLLSLGMILLLPLHVPLDLMAPLLLLTSGLPIESLWTRMAPASASRGHLVERLWRWGVLLACGTYLWLNFRHIGQLTLHGVLPQIALGYVFAFLLVNRVRTVQVTAVTVILVGYWLAFLLYPLPPPGFDPATVGVAPGDEVFTGFFAHWNKNTNLAADFDVWLLNLLPRSEPFVFSVHGYQTLNFIPTMPTMILGIMTGEYLRRDRSRHELRNGLVIAGGLAILGGLLAGWLLCPIVKSIWTPSWVLFSGGCALLALAALYHLIDVRGWRGWSLPLVVAGMNPILLYVLAYDYRWWVVEAWGRTLGPWLFASTVAPVIESVIFLASMWVLAFLLHRLRIYIRI